MESNYYSICGNLLNEEGFYSDPEYNIPEGFTKVIFVKNPTKYWSEIISTVEPNWENCNNKLDE